jgi:hypothetical protein
MNRRALLLPVAPALLLLAACPAPSPASGPGSGEAPEHGSVTAQPGSGPLAAAPPVVSGGVCDLVPLEGSGGGVTCPEGCVLIKGAPVVPEARCALIGARWEVAMGCLRPPLATSEPGACYVDGAGNTVVTALNFPDLVGSTWRYCDEGSPLATVQPCTAEALAAAAGSGAPAPIRLRADGTLVEEEEP